MALPAVLLAAGVSGALYDYTLSATGQRLAERTWERSIGRHDVVAAGNATGADHVCLARSEFTLDPVAMHFMTAEGAAGLPEFLDGYMGILDARAESTLGALAGRQSVPTEQQRAHHHYALRLGKFLPPPQNAYQDGSFQYEGYDTGAYERPVWTELPKEARAYAHPSYGAVHLKALRVVYREDGAGFAPPPAGPTVEDIPWTSDGFKTAEITPGSALAQLESTAHRVLIPRGALAAGYGGDVDKVWKVVLVVSQDGSATGENITIEVGPDALLGPNATMDVAAHDGGQVILGGPVFRAVNVVFETNRAGLRTRVGFSRPRDRIAASEEFMATPVVQTGERHHVRVAVGGPWGVVQGGFRIMVDTTFAGLILREGKFTGETLQRPYVGSFLHLVVVMLVVLPTIIAGVLWDANQRMAAGAASPRGNDNNGGDEEMASVASASPTVARKVKA